MDNRRTLFIVESIIDNICAKGGQELWEKQVMLHKTNYVIKGAIMFAPKMFLMYPDHKYDDIYITHDDVIEPVSI
jgi:hypothetical protein